MIIGALASFAASIAALIDELPTTLTAGKAN
jgi:hypothetical protein